MKKLYRSDTNKVLAGVCGGIGEYLNIDPVIVRVLFILFTFGGGSGLFLYLILMLVIPEKPTSESTNVVKEEPVWEEKKAKKKE